ncbi:glycerol-3-phosphate o-acyltransferase [Moniliophthora roreri MCA 2997]|uniref:Glycerol-3-phosphate o-acyltransferase n=1 Tax=Moniliophthora roreri (strain MCA 2997) TaxID=1381753 RepID=V2YSX3_MONRO|nr:glycerol-3-phosphate o-acyltransferase [Moniliophthora roreri MCA 2997]
MVELKLVYRTLRKISDWTIAGYYDGVQAHGRENVPKDGPLIIVSTHHNEIIDIATLAATIPHRRHLSFWAKSSMFKSSITRAIMLSSGAIPVNRNLNRGSDMTNETATSSTQSQSNLFTSSSQALAKNKVIGVFPEGTSYTQPSIVQIMSGAAWAAVEYVKWDHDRAIKKDKDVPQKSNELVIVPVAIVYTDKSRYLSRVRVQYGRQIRISKYTQDLFSEDADSDERSRAAVKEIMADIKRQLFEMTINAPDWETFYGAQTARDILWGEESNIPLTSWVAVSQTLIRLFTKSPDESPAISESLLRAKLALTRYYSLLHFTSLTHPLAETMLPLPFSIKSSSPYPPRTYHIRTLARRVLTPGVLLSLPLNIVAFILFLPAFITHIPAYIASHVLVRALAVPGEEEGIAQYAAVGAGLGFGAGFAAGSWKLALRCMQVLHQQVPLDALRLWLQQKCPELLSSIRPSVGAAADTVRAVSSHMFWKTWPGKLLGTILCGWATVKWHGLFIQRFHSKYKMLVATTRLQYLLVLVRPSAWAPPPGFNIEPYTNLPPPPANEFIRERAQTHDDNTNEMREPPPPIPSRQLLSRLLDARETAKRDLHSYLQEMARKDGSVVDRLQVMGANISQLSR